MAVYPVAKAFREKRYGVVTEAYELAKEGKTAGDTLFCSCA